MVAIKIMMEKPIVRSHMLRILASGMYTEAEMILDRMAITGMSE